MSAVLHVRPVARDDSQAFVVRRCFFAGKSLQIRVQKAGAGSANLAALEAILDSWSQHSHGIKF